MLTGDLRRFAKIDPRMTRLPEEATISPSRHLLELHTPAPDTLRRVIHHILGAEDRPPGHGYGAGSHAHRRSKFHEERLGSARSGDRALEVVQLAPPAQGLRQLGRRA